MLRFLFGEPKRPQDGLIFETQEAIRAYSEALKRMERKGQLAVKRARYLDIWLKSFLNALDELEQSVFCSMRYAQTVKKSFEEDMKPGELDNYRRHVYFYKNAFIRVFSLLDKVGVFLDDLLELHTSQVKTRFSYFTVLRQVHDRKVEPRSMAETLFAFKEQYKEPLNRLRYQRNREIHSINIEFMDDWARVAETSDRWTHVENVAANQADLMKSYEMVCLTLKTVFEALKHRLH